MSMLCIAGPRRRARPMTRALLALVSLIGWLIDHHVQTANRKATR